jgi:hypothetical protein
MKKVFSFLFFYIYIIFVIIVSSFALFCFSVLFLIQKLCSLFMSKKAQKAFEDIIDDISQSLGGENQPHIEAENFVDHDQQNKHPNPEITS